MTAFNRYARMNASDKPQPCVALSVTLAAAKVTERGPPDPKMKKIGVRDI